MTDDTLGSTHRPSTHRPLRDVVTAELRRLILAGELSPGERLVEDRLAERLPGSST
jgi:DNA-binding GntR family transcriptional regulator